MREEAEEERRRQKALEKRLRGAVGTGGNDVKKK